LFWYHFIFAWLETSQDIQALGYISGTAFAESLTALLDGDGFTLGYGKAAALQVMAPCPWTALCLSLFFLSISLTHFCQLPLLLGRPF
jgi:hypothetical protein